MECLICKKIRKKWFPIDFSCGAGQHTNNDHVKEKQNTIRDDIIEFLGSSVEDYLNDGQCVCNICMNMLDEIVTNKQNVFDSIRSQGGQKYAPKLGKFWNFYQTNFSYDYGDITPSNIPSTSTLTGTTRDSTPLVFISNSKPYNEPVEKIFEIREGLKRELREDLRNIDENSRWDDQKIGRGQKQKISYKSKSTVIKKLKRDLANVHSKNLAKRPFRASSDISFLSSTADEKEEFREQSSCEVKKSNSKRGRKKKSKQLKRDPEMTQLRCPHLPCRKLNFDGSLAFYTSHRIEVHDETPYYSCSACGNEYFTKEHLEMHMKNHDRHPVLCGICGVMQENVSCYQKHVEKHLKFSFQCFLCDMTFLTKKDWNNHILLKHGQSERLMDTKSYKRPAYKILQQKNYEKEGLDTDCSTTAGDIDYNSITMIMSTQNPDKFRPYTFRTWFVRQKLRSSPTESESDSQRLLSLGDDLFLPEENEVDSDASSDRITDSPGSIHNQNNVASSSTFRKQRVRSNVGNHLAPFSPYERINVHSDEYLTRLEDLPAFNSSNNWYQTRRDLESRSSEIEQYLASESEEDGEAVRMGFFERGESELETQVQ
ncbi:uncharacterized protein [Euwallacea fornicatus]|uniref:uncharacterized protein n=1 Tax=Euwallacea fornicatus TaxID=995702 RepID=UPI00338E772A